MSFCLIQHMKYVDIASFIVVNRHRQLVAFGATLLSNERVEFIRLFSDAMTGQQPSAIITFRTLQ